MKVHLEKRVWSRRRMGFQYSTACKRESADLVVPRAIWPHIKPDSRCRRCRVLNMRHEVGA